MRTHRFTSTTLFLWSGLLIYALSFLVVYIFAALACARGFADAQVLGIPVVPLVANGWGVLAAAAMIVVILRVRQRDRQDDADEHTRLIRFLAAAASGIAMLALIWLMLPTLILGAACGR
jgi:hypothetical protein